MVGKPKEINHSEDLDVDGIYSIKIHLEEILWEGVDWINLAQDKNKWRVCFEQNNEHWGSLEYGNSLTKVI